MKPPRKTSTTATVAKCNAALKEAGGVRLTGFLRPDGAAALSALLDAKYAGSRLAVINAALLDAHKKLERVGKTPIK